jgi:hypothetical protein
MSPAPVIMAGMDTTTAGKLAGDKRARRTKSAAFLWRMDEMNRNNNPNYDAKN